MRSNKAGGSKPLSVLLDSNARVLHGDDTGSGCVGRSNGDGGFFTFWHTVSRGRGDGTGDLCQATERPYPEGDGPWADED